MKWNLDPTHSLAEFAVKHLMISTVKGRFRTLEGEGETAEDGTLKSVKLSLDVASIDTNEAKRDGHLRSPDFFDADSHPRITFLSTEVTQQGSDVTIHGDLTIRGTTRAVTLRGEFTPPVKDPWGNLRAALVATAKINRKDFGLVWNMALETGGVVVGEEVKVLVEVEAVAAAQVLESAA
jgi:polyisoprenoid-binding protein YceI